jgi:small-conductance mechanosensitive channel
MSILDQVFLDNTVRQWLAAFGTLIVSFGLLWLLARFVVVRIARAAERTGTSLDDLVAELLRRTSLLFLLVISIFFGSLLLELPDRVDGIMQRVAIIALILQAGMWINAAINFLLVRYRQRTLAEDAAAVTTITALSFTAKVIVWTVVLLLILDNLGVEVTTLVTGLGVGGIAVALALQSILGDLFASLAIVLDKPFVIGDFLEFDGNLGSVENVGLKTTRVRSLSGEQLVVSNSDLLGSRIRNFGRLYERRVLFGIGVTYDTPRDRLEAIPGMLREAVERHEETRFDRSHLKDYGDSSINFETVYYVTEPEYALKMDIQQAINLEVHQRFEEAGIEFAFPTQTIHLQTGGGEATAGP